MATESQTSNSTNNIIVRASGHPTVNSPRVGQKLTISDRFVTDLGFWLLRQGSPNGTLTFTIRDLSDNILASREFGLETTVSTTKTYYEVAFGFGAYVNEEVRILVESTNSATSNDKITVWGALGDIKANEGACEYKIPPTAWTDYGAVAESAYVYTYDGGSQAPTVVTDNVADVTGTTATGYGDITSIGNALVTQHGFVWGLTADPEYGVDSGTEHGSAGVGLFNTPITNLIAGETYHVRAYAVNSFDTAYGADRSFTTPVTDSPAVSTQEVTSLTTTTGTGNGTILDIGASAITQYGHVWKVQTDPITSPTTSDNKTTNGTRPVGAFTSALTLLTAGETYTLASYATNTQGTNYGNNVSFVAAVTESTGGGTSSELSGGVRVYKTRFEYKDAYGNQRGATLPLIPE